MTKFESEDTLINAPSEKIFNFLSNFSNFEQLLPSEISDWSATNDECKFTIQGFLTLNMEISKRMPFHLVEMKSKGNTIFDFLISSKIEEKSKNLSTVKITFEADLSPMMSMIATKPLENFISKVAIELKTEMEK
jgi:carbon monoxide dehydrogenase subunit G